MGLYPNERIYVSKKSLGMWVVGILDSRNNIINTIALREEEFERMCLIT